MKLRSILYTVYGISLVVAIAAPARAQGVEDVARAKAQLDAAGVSLETPCGVTMLTNLVAWNLRGAGPRPAFGLLHKAIGHRAVLKADGSCIDGEHTNDPAGTATDYVIERASGYGWDILTSWLAPSWQGPETVFTARNWSEFTDPFDPAPYLTHAAPAPPIAAPPVGTPPAPPIVAMPASSGVEGILLGKVDQLAARVEQLYAVEAEQSRAAGEAHASINQNITDGRAEARPAIQTIKAIGAFTGKYVLPAVGGWLTAKHFQ